MVRQVVGNNIQELEEGELLERAGEFEFVVMDLGTGDGKYAYQFARENPETFVIGIDADKSQLKEVSHKANRKPAKGGLDNLIYLWSAVEVLPEELHEIADQITINFPWGSLLAGVMKAEPEFLQVISNLLKPGGEVTITTSYDHKFEPETIEKHQLPPLHQVTFLDLDQKYSKFNLVSQGWNQVDLGSATVSSWPKQITAQRDRMIWQGRYVRLGGAGK